MLLLTASCVTFISRLQSSQLPPPPKLQQLFTFCCCFLFVTYVIYILTILVSYHPYPPSPLLLLLNYLKSNEVTCRVCRTIMNLDDKSKISFLIRQGTLPRQSVFVGFIHGTEFRWHSVDGVSIRNWFLGGRWRNRVGSAPHLVRIMRHTWTLYTALGTGCALLLQYLGRLSLPHCAGRWN